VPVGADQLSADLRRYQSRGEELQVARQMMKESGSILGKLRVQLWLLDALYFNTQTIKIARQLSFDKARLS
jgi:hypothetical protein